MGRYQNCWLVSNVSLLTAFAMLLTPNAIAAPPIGLGASVSFGAFNPAATVSSQGGHPPDLNIVEIENSLPVEPPSAINFLDLSLLALLELSPHFELTAHLSFSLPKAYTLPFSKFSQLGVYQRQSRGVVYQRQALSFAVALQWLALKPVGTDLYCRLSPTIGMGLGVQLILKQSYGYADFSLYKNPGNLDGSPTVKADFIHSLALSAAPKFFPWLSLGGMAQLAGLRIYCRFLLQFFVDGLYASPPILLSQANDSLTHTKFQLPQPHFYTAIEVGLVLFLNHSSWKYLQQQFSQPLKPYAGRIG